MKATQIPKGARRQFTAQRKRAAALSKRNKEKISSLEKEIDRKDQVCRNLVKERRELQRRLQEEKSLYRELQLRMIEQQLSALLRTEFLRRMIQDSTIRTTYGKAYLSVALPQFNESIRESNQYGMGHIVKEMEISDDYEYTELTLDIKPICLDHRQIDVLMYKGNYVRTVDPNCEALLRSWLV